MPKKTLSTVFDKYVQEDFDNSTTEDSILQASLLLVKIYQQTPQGQREAAIESTMAILIELFELYESNSPKRFKVLWGK